MACGGGPVRDPVLIPDLVSTVIPVHNRPDLLQQAVASVLGQNWPHIEVIVVDDGSDDATPAMIAWLRVRHPDRFRAIRRERAGGPGAAREAGRGLVRGEFVQYLDSDDTLAPGKLRSQVEALRRHPACDICYGREQAMYRRRDGSEYVVPHDVPVIDRLFPRLFFDRPWFTFNPLYRRAIVDRVGPWTPLWFSEDIEYDSRMAAADTRLCYIDVLTGTLSRTGRDHLTSRALSRQALIGWTYAHEAILANARRCGVPLAGPEFEWLTTAMFAVARQCGAAGLATLSERLFEGTRAIATRPAAPAFRVYRAVARRIGWRAAGVLARCLDQARAWGRRRRS